MDEPKYTKQAVSAIIIKDERFLLLWRHKWETEGTPFLLPGGGLKEKETIIEGIKREIREEIGTEIDQSILRYEILKHTVKTEWTGRMYYVKIVIPKQVVTNLQLDTVKFAGYVWMPFNSGIIMNVQNLLMPGVLNLLHVEWPKLFKIKR